MSRFPPVKKPVKPHLILITAAGTTLYHELEKPPGRSFIHAGRLWVFNEAYSNQQRKPVFYEMTDAIIADMRRSAAEVMQMANGFEFSLKQLAEQAKEAPTIIS